MIISIYSWIRKDARNHLIFYKRKKSIFFFFWKDYSSHFTIEKESIQNKLSGLLIYCYCYCSKVSLIYKIFDPL